MNVLITSSASEMGQLISGALASDHTICLTDGPGESGPNTIACDLGHDEETDRLCDGIDTIVLVCEPEGLSDSEVIDHHSRKVYNLLTAAIESSVDHVVLVSSLRLFDAANPDHEIDEQWAPPVTPEPDILRFHVAEFVCREFARANRFPITCLRFGEVAQADAGDNQVTKEAVCKAVSAAIDHRRPGWSVYHVVSAGTHFLTRRVEEALEIQPRGDA